MQAVEVELDCDHVNSGRSAVLGEVDSVAADGEERVIWVILFREITYTYAPIHDILELGDGDFVAANE